MNNFLGTASFLLIAILLMAPPLLAQEEPLADPMVVDLAKAVSMALNQNTDLQRSRNEETRARSYETEAYGVAMPDLNLSATYTKFGNIPKADFGGQTLQLMPDEDMTLNVNLHQWLFSGSVGAGLRGAQRMVAAAEARTRATTNDIVARVTIEFYAVLFAREMVTVQKESVRQLKSLVHDSKEREAVGLNTNYDTLRFETRLASAIPALIEAKNGFEKAKNALLDSLGIDPLRRVEIVGKLGRIPLNVTAKGAQDRASQNRGELQAAKKDVQVADEYVTAARSQMYPKVSAFGNWRYTTAPGDLSGESKWRDEWDAGLKIEMNIFDGRERSSRMKREIVNRENARLASEQRERQIALETRNAFDEFIRAEEFVVSQEKNVGFAEETYRIARERHQAGMTTQLELMDTQLSLTRAKADYSRSLYDYLAARTRLLRAMGEAAKEVKRK